MVVVGELDGQEYFPANQGISSFDLSGLSKDVKVSLPLPKNFYARHLGLMCRGELMVQKRFPIFFRLGSLEYVNKIEGKR